MTLTLKQMVYQSWLCHPEWTAEIHQGYLKWEEFIPDENLPSLRKIAGWLASFGDHTTAVNQALKGQR